MPPLILSPPMVVIASAGAVLGLFAIFSLIVITIFERLENK